MPQGSFPFQSPFLYIFPFPISFSNSIPNFFSFFSSFFLISLYYQCRCSVAFVIRPCFHQAKSVWFGSWVSYLVFILLCFLFYCVLYLRCVPAHHRLPAQLALCMLMDEFTVASMSIVVSMVDMGVDVGLKIYLFIFCSSLGTCSQAFQIVPTYKRPYSQYRL